MTIFPLLLGRVTYGAERAGGQPKQQAFLNHGSLLSYFSLHYFLIPTEVELSGDDESLIHLTEKPIILPKLSRRAFRSS